MLQLRPQHDQAMKAHAIEQYVERTLAQFQDFFPRHCEINGEEPMRKMIRLGVERAKAHDIIAERNVVLYTTIMLLFGSFFDEDPMTPWAKQVLNDQSSKNESQRAEKLYDEGEAHWQKIAGEDNRNMVLAIDRLRKLDLDEVAAEPERNWPERLEAVFPARCRAIGKPGLNRLVQIAGKRASRHGLKSPRDRALFSGLILMLGTRFDEDPMYPWVREALESENELDAPDARDAPDRGEQLLAAAHAYADAWLQNVKENA